MTANFLTIFSDAFSWQKMYEFRLQFHRSLFPMVQLTISQHWFRWTAPNHFPNQWWHASPFLNSKMSQYVNWTLVTEATVSVVTSNWQARLHVYQRVSNACLFAVEYGNEKWTTVDMTSLFSPACNIWECQQKWISLLHLLWWRIYVSVNLVIVGLGIDLSPVRGQTIAWIISELLPIGRKEMGHFSVITVTS